MFTSWICLQSLKGILWWCCAEKVLHSSPYRCRETALADYLQLVVGALQDTMSNIRINTYGDEHWAAVPEMETVAGKLPGRRQTGGFLFAMTEICITFTCLLSFLISHSSFSQWLSRMGFAPILAPSLPYVSLSKFFSFLNFHWFINLSLLCLLHSLLHSHCLLSSLFLSLSLIHSFFKAPLPLFLN